MLRELRHRGGATDFSLGTGANAPTVTGTAGRVPSGHFTRGVDSRNYVCILPISAAARIDTRHLLIAQSRQVCAQGGNICE